MLLGAIPRSSPALQAQLGHGPAASVKGAHLPASPAGDLNARNTPACHGAEPLLPDLMREYPHALGARLAGGEVFRLRLAPKDQRGVFGMFKGVAVAAKHLNVRSFLCQFGMRRNWFYVMAMQKFGDATPSALAGFSDCGAKDGVHGGGAVPLEAALPQRVSGSMVPALPGFVEALDGAVDGRGGSFGLWGKAAAAVATIPRRILFVLGGRWRILGVASVRAVHRLCENGTAAARKLRSAGSADIRADARARVDRLALPFLGLREGNI